MDKDKMTDYLKSSYNGTGSDLDRFLKDLLMRIEFGEFDAPIEDEEDEGEVRFNHEFW